MTRRNKGKSGDRPDLARRGEAGELGDLERPDDLRFQEATWRFQRRAWTVMVLILLAALAGLFGGGPLATGTVGQPAGARATYPRTCRMRSGAELVVVAPVDASGRSRVELPAAFLERFGVLRIEPTPDRVEATEVGQVYTVGAGPAGGLAPVRFALNPLRPGLFRGRVRAGGGAAFEFTTLVFP